MAAVSFTYNLCADLGSENTYLLNEDSKNVYHCASAVMIDTRRSSDVYAVGDEAKHMEGRTDEDTRVVYPISYGAVGDTELAAMLLAGAYEKYCGKKRSLDKCRAVLLVNEGATTVERSALAGAAQLAGLKRITVLKTPVAIAAALKKHIERPEAQLVISIGAKVTEISLVSACQVVLSRHMKTGSNAFDTAITEYVRTNKGLVIPPLAARELKHSLGNLSISDTDASETLYGRNIKTGRPVTENITNEDIRVALQSSFNSIISGICDALFNVPAEFTNDILKNGICLSGGGSMLAGLKEKLAAETGLEVCQNEAPQYDTVRGAMLIAADEKLLRQTKNAYSAYEV